MSGTTTQQYINSRLEHAIKRARLVLYWEQLWPRLWLPLGVAGAFILLSWLGLWILLPPTGRMAGVLLIAFVFVLSAIPAIAVHYPARRDALRMLDHEATDVGIPDPASVMIDNQALGQSDPASRALWELHRRKAQAVLEKLRTRMPQPATAQFDLYGLRGALIVALVAAAFIAGSERSWRFALAFDWRNTHSQEQSASRADGWIDPPAYTRLPPVMLDLVKAGKRDISVPVGSVLVLRFAGQQGLYQNNNIETSSGLVAQLVPQGDNSGIIEHRYTISGSAEMAVKTPDGMVRLTISAIPDNPPTISFNGRPENTRRGGLIIAYKTGDDYGVAEAQAGVTLPGEEAGQALVPAPVINLPLPRAGEKEQQLRTTVDLADHPWAGTPVDLTLVARNGAGQEGRSETLKVTLPQRPFYNPLARALVEQRRNLVFRPHEWREVLLSLRALQIAPDVFTPQSSIYLGLVTAEKMLRHARKKDDFINVADYLWGMAIVIEDGDAADTERALKAAQQALQEAIERNAPEEEIARLSKELRDALNRHLSEMARNQMRNSDQSMQSGQMPSRTITPEELAKMIDRMEQMARNGDLAGAQRLMQQLQDILENLQTAQGAPSSGSQAGKAGRAMKSIDNMMRNQQRLRDDTYRKNGEQVPEGSPTQQDLQNRQESLRSELDRLQRGLAEQGLSKEPGLDAAGRAMQDAEENLAQGDTESAVDAQGKALEALLNGAQGLAQQMRQAQQGEDGESGPQQSGDNAQDPLGRSKGNRWSDGDTRVPGANESTVARARRILDELRRRLGEQNRPTEERDYLERLLRR